MPGECRAMPRTQHLSEADLERELVRKSVSLMDSGRHRCSDCGRTPLVGEHAHVYGRGIVVCSLSPVARRCSAAHRARPRRGPRGDRARAAQCRLSPDLARGGYRQGLERRRAPARGGLCVPRRHRQPRRVLDHYLVDWHLTRRTVGLGAGARFTVDVRRLALPWADMTFAEVDAGPDRRARARRQVNRIRTLTLTIYELEPADRTSRRGSRHATRPSRRCSPTGSTRRWAAGAGCAAAQGARAAARASSRGRGRGPRTTIAGGARKPEARHRIE